MIGVMAGLAPLEDRADRVPFSPGNEKGCMVDPTLAEAVLDRFCQASIRIAMKGTSIRKLQPGTTTGKRTMRNAYGTPARRQTHMVRTSILAHVGDHNVDLDTGRSGRPLLRTANGSVGHATVDMT